MSQPSQAVYEGAASLPVRGKLEPRAAADVRAGEPIAVVGMACRFPGGADDIESLWELLLEGRDAIGQPPPERQESTALTGEGQLGGYLRNVLAFEAEAFGINNEDAPWVDPQHRLLLEVVSEALHDAGVPRERAAGSKTGVFLGMQASDAAALWRASGSALSPAAAFGSLSSAAAARIADVFDLRGPCWTLDSACSSSLVATHAACQSLHSGESELALVAGVQLIGAPAALWQVSQLGVLAPDGRSKPFSADADGIGWSEGCGVVALERLSDAIARGDRVLALIRGSAVSHGGRNGLLVPSGRARREVVAQALQAAKLPAERIGFVETHGSGQLLSDVVEVEALREVFEPGRSAAEPCALGALKGSLGHMGAAAGVGSLIKAVLAVSRGIIPPNLHCAVPHPDLSLEGSPLFLPMRAQPWSSTRPRCAGVSAFGWTGTHAHVVLEQSAAPVARSTTASRGGYLLTLCASDDAGLRTLAHAYAALLRRGPEAAADICRAAARRVNHRGLRRAWAELEPAPLAAELERFAADAGAPSATLPSGRSPNKLAFVFVPESAALSGVGRELYRHEPAFRAVLDAFDLGLRGELACSPRDWLFRELGAADDLTGREAASVALQCGVAHALSALGVTADAVLGIGSGELAAACFTQVLSVEQVCRVLIERERARVGTADWEMMWVGQPADALGVRLGQQAQELVVTAAISASSCALAGRPAALDRLREALSEEGIACRRYEGAVGYHVRPIATSALRVVRPERARLPMYAGRVGGRVDGERLDADYFHDHAAQPMQIASALDAALDDGHAQLLELLSHPLLRDAIEPTRRVLGLDAAGAERLQLLRATAALYSAQCEIDLASLYAGTAPHAALPLRPWKRSHHRVALESQTLSTVSQGWATGDARTHGRPQLSQASHGPRREPGVMYLQQLRARCAPEAFALQLAGARLPALSILLEGALAAADARGLDQITVERPIALTADADALQLELHVRAEGAHSWICVYANAGSTSTDSVRVRARASSTQSPAQTVDLDSVRRELDQEFAPDALYGALQMAGLEVGAALRVIERLFRSQDAALARLAPATRSEYAAAGLRLAPALLESGLQLLAAMVGEQMGVLAAVEAIDKLNTWQAPDASSMPEGGWVHARLRPSAGAVATVGDLWLTDPQGRCLATLEGVRLAAFDPTSLQHARAFCYELAWRSAPLATETTSRSTASGQRKVVLLSELPQLSAPLRRQLVASGHTCELVGDAQALPTSLPALASADPTAAQLTVVYVAQGAAPEATWWSSVDRVLQVCRALAASGAPRAQLWLVTCGAQGQTQWQTEHPHTAAALWGFGRVAFEEHHELRGGLVDLDPAASAETQAVQLAHELSHSDGERDVMYRGETRRVLRLARAGSWSERPATWARTDAAHLITGGLGGIGLEVARWLARGGARHLVLVNRTPLPERRHWLDPQLPALARERIDRVLALEALGASVEVVALDVSDEAQLQKFLVERQQQARPPIFSVMHAAAVSIDALIRDFELADLHAALDSARAAFNLHRVFEREQLEHFVVFSSMASLVGVPGQAGYAAAKSFQDALVAHRRARGLPATGINWGFWRDVGLTHAGAGRKLSQRAEQIGIGRLNVPEALELLDTVLATDCGQVVALKADFRRWTSQLGASRAPRLLAELVEIAPSSARDEGLLAELQRLEFSGRASHLEQHLRVELARALKTDPEKIDVHVPLGDFGMDSFVAVELRNRLESSLGLTLSATLVWNYPTVHAIAEHLAQLLAEQSSAAPAAQQAAAPQAAKPEAHAAPAAVDDLTALLEAVAQASEDELQRAPLKEDFTP